MPLTLYKITLVPWGLFGSTLMLIVMTITCWSTFSFRREGFIPQMYGSIRVLCAATSRLDDFNDDDVVKWGDREYPHSTLHKQITEMGAQLDKTRCPAEPACLPVAWVKLFLTSSTRELNSSSYFTDTNGYGSVTRFFFFSH